MKRVLKDREKTLEAVELELVLPEDKPWEKLPGEPDSSHGMLMHLINGPKKKTIAGLFNYLEENNITGYKYEELRQAGRKWCWIERAWAYEASLGEKVKERNEKAMELVQTEMEKFALRLIEKNNELLMTKDAESTVTEFAGLMASAKANLPTQIATVYKAMVGDKAKITVDGKFDHTVAMAVATFAKETL